MKESEGGEGIQKAEEILLEEGEGAFGIEPAAEVLDEKETAELLEDPCRSTAEGGDMEEKSRPITLGPSHEIHFGPSAAPAEDKVLWLEAYYPRSSFSNGICDCCVSGWKNACFVYFCQPCAQASARTRMNGSDWWFNLFCGYNPFSSAGMRSIIREGYNIDGNCMADIVEGTLCASCSNCQILSEVDGRGPGEAHWRAKRNAEPQPWSEELFDFNPDCNVFLCGLCCSCCAFAYSRFLFDTTDCIFNLFCVSCCMHRSIIAEGYNIEGKALDHVLLPCFLPCCTACQLLSEVKKRGRVNALYVAVSQSETMIR